MFDFNSKFLYICCKVFEGFEIAIITGNISEKNQEMDKKNSKLITQHLKTLKQQFRDRKLINVIIDLIAINDHSTLAFIARNYGIPPQLRHVVWPILLKYHPMCIAPNIYSNVIFWDAQTSTYQYRNQDSTNSDKKKNNSNNTSSNANTDTNASLNDRKEPIDDNKNIKSNSQGNNVDNDQLDLERTILHDLRKYFHLRSKKMNNDKNNTELRSKTSSSTLTVSTNTKTNNIPNTKNSKDENFTNKSESNDSNGNTDSRENLEENILTVLKDAIMKFLSKWSKIFKYENGIAWVALGLAEWFPPIGSIIDPIILTGRKHSKDQNDGNFTNSINKLYKEYPLPLNLQKKLPVQYEFQFDDLLERLLLVILNEPDTLLAKENVDSKYPSKHMSHYFPILSGGDLSFQTQIFFKVFATALPELYQPLMDETNFPQTSAIKSSWLYWWIKFAGARAFQKQDRGRVWDILIGWRPEPNMNSINFYLNYNNKIFDHIYKKELDNRQLINDLLSIKKTNKHDNDYSDPFWFPDLDSVSFGTDEFQFDYNIFTRLLSQNKYVDSSKKGNASTSPNITPISSPTLSSTSSFSVSSSSISSPSSTPISKVDFDKDHDACYTKNITYSLMNPHTELIFIYMAILQYNEFKLLEFEETEISQFLNNVPMLSRTDDSTYRKLFTFEEYSQKFDNNSAANINNFKKGKSYSISLSATVSSSEKSEISMNDKSFAGQNKNYNASTDTKIIDNSGLISSDNLESAIISTKSSHGTFNAFDNHDGPVNSFTTSKSAGNSNNKTSGVELNERDKNCIKKNLAESRPMSATATISTSSGISTSLSSTSTNMNSAPSKSVNGKHPISAKQHMTIELGNDAKASHSFNDILNNAGDIWRKWLWKELEDNFTDD